MAVRACGSCGNASWRSGNPWRLAQSRKSCGSGRNAAHAADVAAPAGGVATCQGPGGTGGESGLGDTRPSLSALGDAVLPRVRLLQNPCTLASPKVRKSRHPFHQCGNTRLYWGKPEWHSVKRNLFYINPLRRIILHVFPGRPLRLAGQSSLDSPGGQFAPRDGQYSGQVGLASPKRYAG